MNYFFRRLLGIIWVVVIVGAISMGKLCGQMIKPNVEECYIHYTLESGLPTGMIYNCVQDKNGFMWFGSFAGLIRFDGHDFYTFTKKEGLPDNEILSTSIDSFGRIWAYPFSKTPIYIYQNKIYSEKNDSTLKQVENTSMKKFKPSILGGMWLSGAEKNGKTDIYYYGKNRVKTYSISPTYHPIAFNFMDTLIQIICKDSIIYPQKPQYNTYFPYFYTEKIFQSYFETTENGFYIVMNSDKKCMIQKYENKGLGNPPKLVKNLEISQKVMATYYYNHKLYLSFRLGGYGILGDDNMSFDSSNIQLKDVFIGGITVDNQESIWFATMGDGIYCLPANPIYKLNRLNAKNKTIMQSIFIDSDGERFIGNSGGEIQRFDAHFTFSKSIQIGTGQYNRILRIEKSIFYPEDLYIVCDEGFFIWHNYKQQSLEVEKLLLQASKTLFQSKAKGLVYIGTSGFLYQYNPQTKVLTNLLSKRITAVVETSKGELFFAGLDGLYKQNGQNFIHLATKNSKLDCRIMKLLPYKEVGLWVASSSEGLLLVKDDSILLQIDKQSGLSSDILTCVYQDNNGNVWVGTNNGLNKISFEDADFRKPHIAWYSKENGLLDNTINDVRLQNDTVFVATYNGFCIFKDFQASKRPNINMYITNVSINSRDTSLFDTYKLPFHQNTFSLSFTGICLACNEDLYYYYRLLGKQNEWQMTNQKQVEFGALPAGKYVFEVYALNRNNPIKRITFIISPPWWQTHWAIALGILLILCLLSLLAYSFFFYYRKRMQKKFQEEKRIKELEIQALRAQMNPHFIFNCLSSIQYFVNSGEIDDANLYMDKFAKLIRKTLDFSQNAINSVEDELDYIDNYLQLEQMRFGDKFQYNIEVSEGLNIDDIFLPSLILQPFVENAIRHGLRFKAGNEGKLWLRFYTKDNFLVCEVEDNGIGREKSAALKSKQHIEYQSQGMLLSQNRLSLFNTSKVEKMKMEVIDLKNAQKEALGTLIRVYVILDF